MRDDPWPTERSVIQTLRRLLLLILALGLMGTAADLLLIGHYEDGWQMPPLVLIAIALVIVVWLAIRGAQAGWIGVLALRVTMTMFILAGAAGVLLHYNGNREFQLEMDPSLSGTQLLLKVMTAKAPPALAPGVMVQLGLLGLVYTYRHPALVVQRHPPEPDSTGAQA
jgi:hypothetical protein